MPLRGPTPADVQKLHAEINQIGNQRLILTTLGLTLFGVLTAWVVPVSPGDSKVGAFRFAVAIILSILLFVLFLWTHLLRLYLRVMTTYLVETKKSDWERDWLEFRKASYWAQMKPQAMIFLVLNAGAIAFPFLLAQLYSLTIEPNIGATIAIAVGIVTELLMFLIGFCELFYSETKIADRWRAIAERRTPDFAREDAAGVDAAAD